MVLSLPMEGTMVQLHKRFSDEQVIFLLRAYERGLISREKVQDALSTDLASSSFGGNTAPQQNRIRFYGKQLTLGILIAGILTFF